MVNITEDINLSVIIPTLNEANNLPFLLADLRRWDESIEIIVVDGGSSDLTQKIAKLSGAKVVSSINFNRGGQLKEGAKIAKGNWLFFVHADSRLPDNWSITVSKTLKSKSSRNKAWFFNFKVNSKGLLFRLLEIAVYLRSNLLKKPYGDQGLLIHKNIYELTGGYSKLELMEDLEFILRITGKYRISSLCIPIFTGSRKWERNGVFNQSWKNLRLRMRWEKGEDPKILYSEYYVRNK